MRRAVRLEFSYLATSDADDYFNVAFLYLFYILDTYHGP